MAKEIKGVAFLFSETGTEGGWWVVQEDGFNSYDGLHYLEEGDNFTVYSNNDSILWQGVIHQDSVTGLIPHPGNPAYKQQVVRGYWVHWIQAGIDPEVWGSLFIGDRRCMIQRG